ncbi:heavy-metal-associated domain-containing protein [Geosporobacter ferrireducens]|uniref:HMA domain-containing protein n=1 Tax=Geosporobacter ferrireducens TaxID=1424294 RepID=A0A1D8GIH6_9FIRM|nr:heavy-metal-associated domain-containing protein [Geosporobacter ferrireducens]AOT70700.1 hypothetical protein Gferi_14625 [Geosporobacter ferrireducens]MTI57506.1 heavy-metal-associated domain-containing protein [Geosporobacter ferrireducens]
MTTKTYQLETLTCPICITKIEGAVKKMSGVKMVEMLFNASKVKIVKFIKEARTSWLASFINYEI